MTASEVMVIKPKYTDWIEVYICPVCEGISPLHRVMTGLRGICPLCGAREDTKASFARDVGRQRIYWHGGLGPYETKKSHVNYD